MRVVIVNRYATVGAGAEKHAVGLAAGLRSAGHSVRTLSTLADGNVEREGAFVPLTGTDFWSGQPPPRQRLAVAANAVWNRRAAAAMRELIERFEPEVVHAHDLYPQLSASPVVVASRYGVPVVQTLHNYELISASATDERGGFVDRGRGPLSVRGLRTGLGLVRKALHSPRVAVWIAVSRYVADVYARRGIRAHVLPNFVAADGASPRSFAERHGIFFAGRLTEEKGAEDVIALARRLPEIPVTVAGRGPLADSVRSASLELGNLTYAGFLTADGVSARLASARLAVVPSRWQEPAGLVALEAMAVGTPVVAYASGGLAEYVRDARAGRVVAPAVAELAAASRALHDDAQAWGELSANGRRAAADSHPRERYVRRLVDLYRKAGAGQAA